MADQDLQQQQQQQRDQHGDGELELHGQREGPPPPGFHQLDQLELEAAFDHVVMMNAEIIQQYNQGEDANGGGDDNDTDEDGGGDDNDEDDDDDGDGLVIDDNPGGPGHSDQEESGNDGEIGGDPPAAPEVEVGMDDLEEAVVEAVIIAEPPVEELPIAQGGQGPMEVDARPGSRNNNDRGQLAHPPPAPALLHSYVNSPLLSDVRFIVGCPHNRVTFHGHKIIYGLKSGVFRREFEMAPAENEVYLFGAEPSIFTLFNDYIYDNHSALTTHFGPVVQGGIGFVPLLKLAQFSNEIKVPPLVEMCCTSLIERMKSMDYQRIFLIWKFMILALPEGSAMRFVEEYLDRHATSLIQTIDFLQLERRYLIRFLSRDTLQVADEVDLFNAAVRWAKYRCRRRLIYPNRPHMRCELGAALYQIRFTTMEFRAFERLLPQDVLTEHEISCIMHWFAADGIRVPRPSIPFNINRRILLGPPVGEPSPSPDPRDQAPSPSEDFNLARLPALIPIPLGPRGSAAAGPGPGPIGAIFRPRACAPMRMPIPIQRVPLNMPRRMPRQLQPQQQLQPQCLMHYYMEMANPSMLRAGEPSHFGQAQVFMGPLAPRVEHYCQHHNHFH